MTVSRTDLDSAVQGGQDDAVQEQDAVQHVADLRLGQSQRLWGQKEEHLSGGRQHDVKKKRGSERVQTNSIFLAFC